MFKHMDLELVSLVETTVPPADLGKISVFRAAANKYHKRVGCSKQFNEVCAVSISIITICTT